jgi:hypothetical protein
MIQIHRFPLVAAACVFGVALLSSSAAHAVYSVSSVSQSYVYAPTMHAGLSGQDDAASEALTLPFAFPFQDDTFSKLRIHTNGFVTLGEASPSVCGNCATPQPFLNVGQPLAPDYILAPWWADWDPAAEGEIYYGAVGDKFVVEWWNVRPYGAAPGQTYSFELQITADGKFTYVYNDVQAGLPSRDFGATGSSGHQGRSAAGFGFSQMFGGTSLWNGAALAFSHLSNNIPLSSFNQDGVTPDIVERWAPVIWADVNMSDYSGREDIITKVNFDGDFWGFNNEWNMGYAPTLAPMAANVYWSLVQSSTHYYIGYYFYHARSGGSFWDGHHEHDMEGVVVAVDKATGEVEALLSNAHGNYVPYRSLFEPSIVPHPRPTHSVCSARGVCQTVPQFSDAPTFTHFTTTSPTGFFYDTIGVGVEAGTHATWGRWHNRCILGGAGSASNCDSSHGGDGVVYEYRNNAVALSNGSAKAWPTWGKAANRVGYDLLPIGDLFSLAHNPSYAGQNEPTALYRVDGHGMPWDRFNGSGDDAGDPPWAWGLTGVIDHACDQVNGRNMLLQPGWIFHNYFLWPMGGHDACGTDPGNLYLEHMRVAACLPPTTCPITPAPPPAW